MLRTEREMADKLHPVASHHLPPFITGPGESDILMSVMAVFLVIVVLVVGVLFLRLHTLPERIAHKSHKLQFEIVAVLGLLALFTHVHLFWVAGLLLALIDFPDFGGMLARIARSLEKMAGISTTAAPVEESPQPAPAAEAGPAMTRLEPTVSPADADDEVPAIPELRTGSTRG